MILTIIILILFAMFIGQYLIGRSNLPNALGAILPTLWIVAIIFLAVNGQINTIRDYLFSALGFFVSLAILGGGQKAREEKLKKESNKIDNSRGL